MRNFFFYILLMLASTDAASYQIDTALVNSLKKQFSLSQYDHIGNISKFNRDTILISGYLSDSGPSTRTYNVLYRTLNGGVTWGVIHFPGNAWIYCAYNLSDGKIWLGGSDQVIYYSADFGDHWSVTPKPFKDETRVLSIDMTDSMNGLAGGLGNELVMTHDNWKTVHPFSTPYDQGLYHAVLSIANTKVNMIRQLDSILIIDQGNHIYCSGIDSVQWKKINIPVTYFDVNKADHSIMIKSPGNKIYILDHDLNLVSTYVDSVTKWPEEALINDSINMNDFLKPGISQIRIKAIGYTFRDWSGGCIRIPLFTETIQNKTIKHLPETSAFSILLSTTLKFTKPDSEAISFDKADYGDYTRYRNLKLNEFGQRVNGRSENTSSIDYNQYNFNNPESIVKLLNEKHFVHAFREFPAWLNALSEHEPSMEILVINNTSDTLEITGEVAQLASLPWKLRYNGKQFHSFDSRINAYLKTNLSRNFNYYEKFLAGELIFRLIEQKTIDDQEYQNPLK